MGGTDHGTLEGYLACTDEMMAKIHQAGMVETRLFGPVAKFIPFADSATGAVDKAFLAQKHFPEAALQDTTWRVLRVSFTADQAFAALKGNQLERVVANRVPGFRFHGDLTAGCCSAEWFQASVEAMGVDKWADMALTGKFEVGTFGTCAACPAAGVPTWAGRERLGVEKREYCAACWHGFFVAKHN